MMRDHYKGFSHPVLDFEPDMAKSLFAEFDTVANELRAHPEFVARFADCVSAIVPLARPRPRQTRLALAVRYLA
jgi:hypothetical protein